jgi:hypothetical protein
MNKKTGEKYEIFEKNVIFRVGGFIRIDVWRL